MIKKFFQLNQGAVPDKPVVVLVDIKTITSLGREKALPVVNLIKEKGAEILKIERV